MVFTSMERDFTSHREAEHEGKVTAAAGVVESTAFVVWEDDTDGNGDRTCSYATWRIEAVR